MHRVYLFAVVVLALMTLLFPSILMGQSSIYGDANGDGIIDVGDVVYLINYLFKSGPDPDPVFMADVNGDDLVDVGDVVYLINYLFRSGPPPQNFYEPPDSSEIVFDPNMGGYVAQNRIIVAFYDSVSRDTIDARIRTLGAVVKGESREINQFCLEVPDPDGASQVLLADPCVEIVTRELWTNENFGGKGNSHPNDPYFIPYLQRPFLLNRIPLAWETRSSAQGVVVGIVGDGVTGSHPDLGSNLVFRRSCCGAGGNPDPTDGNNHETYIAGEIGALGNNAVGVTGVLWTAHLVSAKCYLSNPSGYTDQTFSDALIFLVNYSAARQKKLVVSISIGVESPVFGRGIMKSIKYAKNQGAIIISAAGLPVGGSMVLQKGYPPATGSTATPGFLYPASFPEVLAVGSVDSLDNHWDLAPVRGPQVMASPAPGWGLTETDYGPARPDFPTHEFDPATSFATPIVAGIAALVWNENLSKTSEQVLQILKDYADPIDPAENFGLGRINAYRSLRAVQGNPAPENKFPGYPTWADPPGAGGNGFITLCWNAPTTNYDGTPLDDEIAGYLIYRKLHAEEPTGWILRASTGGATLQWTDNNVTNGITYDYMISAEDEEFQEGYATQEVMSFTPTLSYYYIKGYVRDRFGSGVAGVSVTLSGGVSNQYVTSSNGYYEFLNLEGGLNYTVTPTKTDWVFSPPCTTYYALDSNKDNQNYSGTPYWYIKGYVRENGVPMQSVSVELTGAYTDYYTTGASGYYEFLNLEGLLNYNVRPSKVGWYFVPDDTLFQPLDGNKDNVDFEGHEIQTPFYIKGYVRDSSGTPMSGVDVGLSGAASGTYTTVDSGYYEFLDLPGGLDYTVTPFKAGWGFWPHLINFYDLDTNWNEQNFTGTLLPSISSMDPRAGLSGTSVTIQGINFGNTQGTSQVVFCNDATATVSTWSDTLISCTVPSSATSGYVNVVSDAGMSNPKYFNIGTGRVRWASNFDDLYYNIASCQDGDMILISPGTYRNASGGFSPLCRNLKLIGDEGAEATIIDAQGGDSEILLLSWQQNHDSTTVIDGITFTGVNRSNQLAGGAIYLNVVSPIISHCVFRNNYAGRGSAIYVNGGAPIIRHNIIRNNSASVGTGLGGGIFIAGTYDAIIEKNVIFSNSASSQGGGVWVDNGCHFTNNTFVANSSPTGSAIFQQGGGPWSSIQNNIFANHTGGYAIYNYANCLDVFCNDFYQNAGGNLGRYVLPQCPDPVGNNGNILVNPLWCDQINFFLQLGSPCADAPGCGLIGARPVGCSR